MAPTTIQKKCDTKLIQGWCTGMTSLRNQLLGDGLSTRKVLGLERANGRIQLVLYRVSMKAGDPIALNYCPSCGVDIRDGWDYSSPSSAETPVSPA